VIAARNTEIIENRIRALAQIAALWDARGTIRAASKHKTSYAIRIGLPFLRSSAIGPKIDLFDATSYWMPMPLRLTL
jgi:hypothetical protein